MAKALYIHWPFCLSKCPYCDFNSHVRAQVDHEAWTAALLTDLRFEAERAGGHPLTSIFFGGGTPSLMPPKLAAALIAEAERCWGFAPDIEITLEANPTSVEASRFADLSAAGVNRVSMGLQSLDDASLRFLGREHDAAEGLAALTKAQAVFDRVSFDLIYALPGQSEEQWRGQLEQALDFGTTHLSLYQLTIEPGTRFASDVRRGGFAPLDDDAAAELFAITQSVTSTAGLPAYEISNHAVPGQESRHNLTYWRYQDYVGIGPGAHGRRGGMATMRHRKPENYLSAVARNGNGLKHETPLPPTEQAAEALLMGLRLAEGVALDALSARFAIPPEAMIDMTEAASLERMGLIARKDDRVTVTPHGMPLLDAILPRLVADDLVAGGSLPDGMAA